MNDSKKHGAYYTPDAVASTLVQWAVRKPEDRLLDPACGDGRFISLHPNSVGIEQDIRAARVAMATAPGSLIHEGDFFEWAASTTERFDCAAGNPPFIRYQTFKGAMRAQALALCSKLGANFSGLSSSWAPFLVATASLLVRGGRLAFVVPAEIGHAPYAAPLIEYLAQQFEKIKIVAVREKFFPALSEDCWLLYADGFGGSTQEIEFSQIQTFKRMERPPRSSTRVSVQEWRKKWKQRLRPFLLPEGVRDLYSEIATDQATKRFDQLASVGIGYVSGDNDFFHLKPSVAAKWNIPEKFLKVTVRNGRFLPPRYLKDSTVDGWRRADEQMLLLRITKEQRGLPRPVKRYLESEPGQKAREAYKCRTRDPWYSVPDVQTPDFFLTYMSGREVSLVRNDAECTCTNSVHSVRLRDYRAFHELPRLWNNPFVQLSCEVEGHPLGGGMLKVEPSEASAILLPARSAQATLARHARDIEEGVSVMHAWRHYG